jgi:histidyl-tRNA synthetase
VLRILDCKVPHDQELAKSAPRTLDHLGEASATHFAEVRSGLDRLGVEHTVNSGLVRGLDYYTGTVFEALASTGLGAQNAVAGGGRYDGLVEELGGRPTSGIGFAAGIERIVMLLTEAGHAQTEGRPRIMLVGADDEGRTAAHRLAHELRARRVVVEVDHRGRSVKAQMKRADRSGAETVLVLGARELEASAGQLKDMATGTVREVSLEAATLAAALES